ncbi:MAG: hypothetical protein AAB402_04530 [Patescibacteria group bacterium]
MTTIHLKKFGNVLVSRPAGREAYNAIVPTLDPATPVQIDFTGVLTVTPSWFDEFITLLAEYMRGQVELLPTDNASVRAILPVISANRSDAAAPILQRALKRLGKTG